MFSLEGYSVRTLELQELFYTRVFGWKCYNATFEIKKWGKQTCHEVTIWIYMLIQG